MQRVMSVIYVSKRCLYTWVRSIYILKHSETANPVYAKAAALIT